MDEGEPNEEEKEALRVLRIAAEQRAAELKITGTDYLIGILEGRYLPFTREELKEAASRPSRVQPKSN